MAGDPISEYEASEIRSALAAMGLLAGGQSMGVERLSGGVSCDVYKVTISDRTMCVKRALPKLRVKADWRAPPQRSTSEVAWLRLARTIARQSVPAILGEDPSQHIFAMEYFPPADYPVWKSQLAGGRIEPEFAETVGSTIAQIHNSTAYDAGIAAAFANDAQFAALRLDPFLRHVAAKYDTLAPRLLALADRVANARIALMHGDVSPKNILRGPRGPIFLDAETACYGDPAFDLAFCLNHLLLKCVWHPEWREGYRECFAHLVRGYRERVAWEAPSDVEARAGVLLPALLLARVDGKSPAEYLNDEHKRGFVRRQAIDFIESAKTGLAQIADLWTSAVARAFA